MTADIARHSLAQTAPYQLGFDLEPGQLGREVRWIMDMKKVDTLMGMAGLGQSAKPAEPAKGPGSVSAKSPPKKRAWRLLSVMIGIVLAVAIMVIGPKEVGSFMAEAWKSMANSLRASEPMLDSDNTDVGVLPNDQDLYIELECSATECVADLSIRFGDGSVSVSQTPYHKLDKDKRGRKGKVYRGTAYVGTIVLPASGNLAVKVPSGD